MTGGLINTKGSNFRKGGNFDVDKMELSCTGVVPIVGTFDKECISKKSEFVKENSNKLRDTAVNHDISKARNNTIIELAVSHNLRLGRTNQQQARRQHPAVRWERFLPQHQLRILLVENDDATRHVVSALLRNCSYRVTSAANGLLAWELLMDQSIKVDLVLTEVVMPCLSGISLLTRIMNHEPLRHIPVIMMSSHDSMGVVFKCLSGGAVDFLVKPVRKNELKNLWQHIWRRCHCSSASRRGGNASGIRSSSSTQKVTRPKTVREPNISESRDDSVNTGSEVNIENGHENGSGNKGQGSWNKKIVGIESYNQLISDGQNLPVKNGCLSDTFHQESKHNDIDGEVRQVVSPGGSTELGFFEKERCKQGLVDVFPMKEEESMKEEQPDTEQANELLENNASNSPSSMEKTVCDSSSPPLSKHRSKRTCQAESAEDYRIRGLKQSCASGFLRYNDAGHIAARGVDKTIAFADNFVQASSVGSNHCQSSLFSSQLDKILDSRHKSGEFMAQSFSRELQHVSGNQENSSYPPLLVETESGTGSALKEDATGLVTAPRRGSHIPPFGPSNLFEPHNNGERVPDVAPSGCGPSSENVEDQGFYVSYNHIQGHTNVHNDQETQIHHHSHHHYHHHHHHIQHHYYHDKEQLQLQMPQSIQEDFVQKCGSINMKEGLECNNVERGYNDIDGGNGNVAVTLNVNLSGSNTGSNGGQSSVEAAVVPDGVVNVFNGTQQTGGSCVTVARAALDPDQLSPSRRETQLCMLGENC
ncbi:hypothetical protein KP509_25G076500 [Ceratopteris richardii]|uniref:Response regulatory domain-containing protein n=2 Tax=Ceratopteris richardii TaxID=49495 RepID=A0A8T2RUF5_CERRI|nr:hypothetical protein KP509_25G076500 [Ceratopteris richardii]